jgi:hypothetical protein
MEQRTYHGNLTPQDVARDLTAYFNRGNLRVQQIGSGDKIAVQIATGNHPYAGGQTALSITLQSVADGVSVQVGNQAWLGVAANLGITALFAMRNPFMLIHRLDDLAQDVESLQLTENVWKVIDGTAKAAGAAHELSDRLRRMVCSYCNTANPVGEASCIACGAPLGDVQPQTCLNCGFVIKTGEKVCPNCGKPLA